MQYHVVLPKKVQSDLANLDARYRPRIYRALRALESDPYLGKPLEGQYKGLRSLALWPYRIIYEIRKQEMIILVIRIGHRQGVY